MNQCLSLIAIMVLCLGSGCRDTPQSQARMQSSTDQEREIQTLRKAYAAFNRGDIAAAVAFFDPQIEWTEPAEFPGGGTYHGQSEVMG